LLEIFVIQFYNIETLLKIFSTGSLNETFVTMVATSLKLQEPPADMEMHPQITVAQSYIDTSRLGKYRVLQADVKLKQDERVLRELCNIHEKNLNTVYTCLLIRIRREICFLYRSNPSHIKVQCT